MIKKTFFIFPMLSISALLLQTGCVSTPPKRVHAGAGLTREVTLPSEPEAEAVRPFAMGGSISRGDSMHDTGKPHGAMIYAGNAEFRASSALAIGGRIYVGVMDGNLDAESHWAGELYSRWKISKAENWSFFLYPTFRHATNEAEDEGTTCTGSSCVGSGQKSTARVRLDEVGVSFINRYHFDAQNSLSFVPSIYGTSITTSSTYINVTTSDTSLWRVNYSAQLIYQHHFLVDSVSFQFAAGASSFQGVGSGLEDTRINPIVQAGFIVGLGAEKETR